MLMKRKHRLRKITRRRSSFTIVNKSNTEINTEISINIKTLIKISKNSANKLINSKINLLAP